MEPAFPLKEKEKSLGDLPSNSWRMKKKRQQRRRRQKATEENTQEEALISFTSKEE